MITLVYRCTARTTLGGNLDDMRSPVQVHFEPVGDDMCAKLNRYGMFSPILPAQDAAEFEVGCHYEFRSVPVAPRSPGTTGTLHVKNRGAA